MPQEPVDQDTMGKKPESELKLIRIKTGIKVGDGEDTAPIRRPSNRRPVK